MAEIEPLADAVLRLVRRSLICGDTPNCGIPGRIRDRVGSDRPECHYFLPVLSMAMIPDS